MKSNEIPFRNPRLTPELLLDLSRQNTRRHIEYLILQKREDEAKHLQEKIKRVDGDSGDDKEGKV